MSNAINRNVPERAVLDRRRVPFVMVTKAVVKDRELRSADKAVYTVLCMYADNRTAECYPSRDTIMKDAGISDHTLRKSIRKLQERGYIAVENRTDRRGQASNLYVLLDVE